MTRPKIVQVIADGSPGGGTTFILGLLADLKEDAGFDLVLVTEENSYLLFEAQKLNIRVHGLSFCERRISRGLVDSLRTLLAEEAPDVIHAHGGRAGFNIALATLARWKFIYTVHGYHFVNKTFMKKIFGLISEHFISFFAKTTVFVSEGDKNVALDYGILKKNRFQVIYNGVEDFGGPKTSEVKKYDGIFIGRFVHQKNPQLAAKAFSRLAERGGNYAMVGGGPLMSEVAEILDGHSKSGSGSVEILGELPRDEALQVLASSKVLILPSRWEGLPITLLEAFQFGIPCIVSNIPGNNEVVEDMFTGFLVEGGADDYADAFQKIKDNAVMRDAFSRNARTTYLSKFDRAKCSFAYAELYRR